MIRVVLAVFLALAIGCSGGGSGSGSDGGSGNSDAAQKIDVSRKGIEQHEPAH